ncbi:hypothetical protein FA10DRAFT_268401 [Acaromyces ingoldii]|uniref:Uncharacterized protein n=1 Tax=Acaromyces ingoldii TaxID=215250 RepID=A0A316YFJ5_9BASI|nr:hypothetical protein FA10DRAFT_268401 [Acaromyces ingoldii]PWN88187.1 hypothetical protein FA10DRAFT_268401 [Acaromyces ingoldii]
MPGLILNGEVIDSKSTKVRRGEAMSETADGMGFETRDRPRFTSHHAHAKSAPSFSKSQAAKKSYQTQAISGSVASE